MMPLLTVDDVDRMLRTGQIREGAPLTLRGGRLVTRPPHDPLHELVVAEMSRRLIDPSCTSRVHAPLVLSDVDLPEPDLSVVPGRPRDWRRHPRGDETVLVIEVAVTTLQDDLDMVGLYASAGVPCLWIVDVNGRRVLVHEHPEDGLYTRMTVHGEEDVLTPPGTSAAIPIRDVLP